MTRPAGVTHAISNTGPLISAFQSDSFALLTQIFPVIYTSTACISELERHGWAQELQAAAPRLVVLTLSAAEQQRALGLAMQIAHHVDAHDRVAVNHLGEAQALVLALRAERRDDLLLLDETAARAIAKSIGAKVSGFPGALLLAVRGGLITPEDLKARLEQCRRQGTHYGAHFIQSVVEMAKTGRRQT